MSIAPFKKLLFFIFFIVFSAFLTTLSNTASADQLKIPFREYAANNIYFVKECDNTNRSSKSVNTTATASGSNADEKIWSALISLGIKPEIAAGILGNIHNEGGASPARHEGCYEGRTCPVGIALNGSSSNPLDFDYENDAGGCMIGSTSTGCGVGLIQWSFGRRTNLFKFAREKNSALVDKYLKHPEKYGGYRGDNFIKAVDNEADANELYAIEVEFLVNEIKTNSIYGGVLKQETVAEAAEYYSMYVEECGNGCKIKGSTENQERIAAAEEIFNLYGDKTSFSSSNSSTSYSLCDCDDGGNLIGSGGAYAGAKYGITDEDTLKRLWWAARAEQGIANAKSELTFFPNRFEHMGGTPGDVQGLISSIHNNGPGGREYASTTVEAYDTGVVHWPNGGGTEVFDPPSAEQIAIVKDIIVNGNRTMPPQVVEHDSISDITEKGGVSNNGASFTPSDRSQYKRDVTKITAYGDPYIFFQWANGETICSSNDCGDPFGYFEKPSASTLTTTETGSTTWDNDGWITSGIDGFTKEDGSKMKKLSKTANQDFTTDTPNVKGKGPVKITITATESPNGAGTSGLELFKSKKESKPPHFTIDLQNKKLYQHFPIYKTSGANTSTDDGIYIAIIGYTDADKAKENKDEKWLLSNLTESSTDYLSELLRGIMATTGIENNSITAPAGISTLLNKSLDTSSTSECNGNNNLSADIKALQETVKKFAWPNYRGSGTSEALTPKPDYAQAIAEGGYQGAGSAGADCGAFVWQAIHKSGYDPEYGGDSGQTLDMRNWFRNGPGASTWTEVTSQIHSNKDAHPGDVILLNNTPEGGNRHHILMYIGDIGFDSELVSASQDERMPMADSKTDIMDYINQGFWVFRKK